MNRVELQRILGYVNIGLAIAHESGVSIGHFGCGDFIQLAQTRMASCSIRLRLKQRCAGLHGSNRSGRCHPCRCAYGLKAGLSLVQWMPE